MLVSYTELKPRMNVVLLFILDRQKQRGAIGKLRMVQPSKSYIPGMEQRMYSSYMYVRDMVPYTEVDYEMCQLKHNAT